MGMSVNTGVYDPSRIGYLVNPNSNSRSKTDAVNDEEAAREARKYADSTRVNPTSEPGTNVDLRA